MTSQPANPMTFDKLCQLASQFPGLEQGTSYGTPGFRARSKFMARMWDDGATLVLRVGELEQEFLIEAEPDIYFITDHYRGSAYVLVRLAQIDEADFHALFERAWRQIASKRDLKAYSDSKE
jgi:hypothetical protein